MSAGLTPVPSDPSKGEENEGDEFWLVEDDECYLKLDFFESAYTLSWPTEYSRSQFLAALEDFPHVSPDEGHFSMLTGESERIAVPATAVLKGDYPPPENTSHVKYAQEQGDGIVEVEWYEYHPHPQIAVYSNTMEPEAFRSFFEESVVTPPSYEDILEQAYDDAVSKVNQQIFE